MKLSNTFALVAALFALSAGVARAADTDADTIKLFKDAGESAKYFDQSFGYAVFPTIGKGGIGIGGAYGKGNVYERGKHIGTVSMSQLSVGFQLGGQAYSQVIFFEDRRALDEFTDGNFEFGAGVGAIAITAAASASATTTGAGTGVSGGKKRRHHHQRRLLQGHDGVHHRQGWPDVRSLCRRPEVSLQGAQALIWR